MKENTLVFTVVTITILMIIILMSINPVSAHEATHGVGVVDYVHTIKHPELRTEPAMPIGESEVVEVGKDVIVNRTGEQEALRAGVLRVWDVHGSLTEYQLNYFMDKCEEVGLDIRIWSAVMAQESTWGSSYYCRVDNNCFGWGKEVSIDRGYNYDTYEEGMDNIVPMIMAAYGGLDIYNISTTGYNNTEHWRNLTDDISKYW